MRASVSRVQQSIGLKTLGVVSYVRTVAIPELRDLGGPPIVDLVRCSRIPTNRPLRQRSMDWELLGLTGLRWR